MTRRGATAGQSGATAREKRPCGAQTVQGAPCGAFALPGRSRCVSHDPASADRIRAARSKGGKVRALQGRRRKLESAAALMKFTSGLIQDVLDGGQPVDVARTALYGVSIARQLVESDDLERRLTVLEERLAAPGGQRWRA